MERSSAYGVASVASDVTYHLYTMLKTTLRLYCLCKVLYYTSSTTRIYPSNPIQSYPYHGATPISDGICCSDRSSTRRPMTTLFYITSSFTLQSHYDRLTIATVLHCKLHIYSTYKQTNRCNNSIIICPTAPTSIEVQSLFLVGTLHVQETIPMRVPHLNKID